MMESSDEENFVLTQCSTKDYEDIPSSQFGEDVIAESASDTVSLESVVNENFDFGVEDWFEGSTQKSQSSGGDVQIEDISSDEEMDRM